MGPRDRAKAADRAATARPTCCTRRACSHSPSRASSEVGSGGDAAASASTSLVAVAMRSLYASDDVGLYDCPRSRLAASESSESLSSVLTLALTNAGAKVAVIAGAARAGVGAARRERPTAATLVSANMFACSSSHEAPGERETQHWGKIQSLDTGRRVCARQVARLRPQWGGEVHSWTRVVARSHELRLRWQPWPASARGRARPGHDEGHARQWRLLHAPPREGEPD